MEGTRILLVVENDHLRKSLKDTLLMYDCHVLEAENGLIAMASVQHFKVQIIISQIEMSVMGGLQLLEHVRRSAELRNVPFIFLTTLPAKTGSVMMGSEGYLNLPYTIKSLITCVKTMLLRTNENSDSVRDSKHGIPNYTV